MLSALSGGVAVEDDFMDGSSLLAEPSQEQRKQPQSIIDDDHLGRMTLGDRSLEREVLEIFARQTLLTLKRLVGAAPARIAAAAHTLKGSAHGIGAWRVARAAERLEQVAAGGDDAAVSAAIAELDAASIETREAIGLRLSDRVRETAADHGGR
jgi:HPt (histidine-containing phosphotransfer) domain-containing protein